MDKFANDSYIIKRAVNSNSRLAEIEHAENWAEKKNLKVNPAKYKEVVFYNKRPKENAQPPPPLPGMERVTTVKILGVTITNSLSSQRTYSAPAHRRSMLSESCAAME